MVDARDLRKGGLSAPLVLLAADSANGLEFDAVVVVEPAVIAGETARGLRTLYVALTRPDPTPDGGLPHHAPVRAGGCRLRPRSARSRATEGQVVGVAAPAFRELAPRASYRLKRTP